MKRSVVFLACCCLAVATLAPSASAWIVAVDTENTLGAPQNNFEMVFNGHVIATGGGKDPATNAFPNPNVQWFTAVGAAPAVIQTGVRFLGVAKDQIASAPGVKTEFGLFGDGYPSLSTILGAQWKVDTTASASVPIASVLFAQLGGGVIQVTVSNQTSNNITVSQVGYRVLGINSFRINNLNRPRCRPRRSPHQAFRMEPSWAPVAGVSRST